MNRLTRLSRLAVNLLFAVPACLMAADQEVDAIEQWYTGEMARLDEPRFVLRTKYLENLAALKLRAQSAGKLEEAVAVTAEIESVDLQKPRDFKEWAALKRLRDIYDTTLAKITNESKPERAKIAAAYCDRLQMKMERLTVEGNLEEAGRLKARVAEMQKQIDGGGNPVEIAAGAGAGKVLWEFKGRSSGESVREVEIKTLTDGWELKSKPKDWAYFESRRTFKPPFRVQLRASTDSTNIRMYYNKEVLAIFNWETNPLELRVHEPSTGRNMGFGGKGHLVPNQKYDIQIDVHPERIEVKVDGELRAVAVAKSTGTDGAIGVGPAFGSILTMEAFRVLELLTE